MAKKRTPRRRAQPSLPQELATLIRVPLSGRYFGTMRSPHPDVYQLELRIDIDRSHPNSLVMDRISGDLFEVISSGASEFTVYRESWIVDSPVVDWQESQAVVTGGIRNWADDTQNRSISITIPWTSTSVGPAAVEISDDRITESFECEWKSNHFREIELEIDVCKSVNRAPLIPSHNTHDHHDRPEDLPQRELTIEEAYAEAGVAITIRPDHTTIDDSASEFESWTTAELHDAMVTHFSRFSDRPQWKMWGVMAGSFENPAIGGVMFDAAAKFGGAGVGPDRQGFAVFRNHSWFDHLVDGPPANQKQAAAARKFLYTWVHEFGHGCNFMHSWDKGRPDALSWMNYDWKYDDRNGEGEFWERFEFTFDDDELRHLRHGERSAVIMGGDSWASGGHLESKPSAVASVEITSGRPPLEFLVRSVGRFEFLEPVEIELRLRNLSKTSDFLVDGNMNPEFGNVAVVVKDPNGRVRDYQPLACKFAEPDIVKLAPSKKGKEGPDRISRAIMLSFGGDGFYFDRPGEYLVRAVYRGADGMLIPSNVHRITVGFPVGLEEEGLAHDFFTTEVGLSLYLGGSQSPRLKSGMNVLESVAERLRDRRAGARVASIVAGSIAQPFFSLVRNKLKKTHEPKPQEALEIADNARELLEQSKDPSVNLMHRRLAEQRSACWIQMGEPQRADQELDVMRGTLKGRGVNPSVLAEIAPAHATESPKKKTSRKSKKKPTTSKKRKTSSKKKKTPRAPRKK